MCSSSEAYPGFFPLKNCCKDLLDLEMKNLLRENFVTSFYYLVTEIEYFYIFDISFLVKVKLLFF